MKFTCHNSPGRLRWARFEWSRAGVDFWVGNQSPRFYFKAGRLLTFTGSWWRIEARCLMFGLYLLVQR